MIRFLQLALLLAPMLWLAQPSGAERRPPDEAQLDQTWNSLTPREKAQALRFYQALRQMPPDERKFITERIERFIHMSPEERRKLKENQERWQKMTPEEREKARERYRQRREEFEAKWRKEHPGQEPPAFLFQNRRKRNLAASTNDVPEGAVPKNKPTTPKEPKS
ncbi:MAG: DUF3106 domain-containing protein [Verrucomicrobiae bacterium]|nr:DUF3106 domain-containing protein [Verrucomicrobiae bacterium]